MPCEPRRSYLGEVKFKGGWEERKEKDRHLKGVGGKEGDGETGIEGKHRGERRDRKDSLQGR